MSGVVRGAGFVLPCALMCVALLFGCKKTGERGETLFSSEGAAALESADKKNSTKIDIDLTKMNYNMASAQIFNMMIETERYLGKRVRLSGKFYSAFDENNGMRHYSVLMWDATACCQTGLQFLFPDAKSYPDDFPAEMADVTLTGILSLKELNGMDYLYIDCESLLPL